jgi:hypothetical protein
MRGGFHASIYWAICRVASLKNEMTTIFWISLQIRQLPVPSAGKDIRMKAQPSFLALTQYFELVDQMASFAGVFTFGRQAQILFVLDLGALLLDRVSAKCSRQRCASAKSGFSVCGQSKDFL